MGQHVTGGHIVTMDEMGKGLDGSADACIVTGVYAALRVDYLALDTSADFITMALRTCVGSRRIDKLYVYRSGESSKTPQNLGAMLQTSHTVSQAILPPTPWGSQPLITFKIQPWRENLGHNFVAASSVASGFVTS